MNLHDKPRHEYSQPMGYGLEVSRNGASDCAPRQISKEAWGVSP